MRIMIALLALLATQVSLPAGQAGGQESPEILVGKALERDTQDRAALQSLSYDASLLIENLDKRGNPKPRIGKEEAGDKKEARVEISIRKWFRPGRYVFLTATLETFHERPVINISFLPGPNQTQPRPEPDPATGNVSLIERAMNEVLNNLQGTISLDLETLGIVRVEAHLKTEITRLVVLKVYQADITHDQQLLFGIWVPQRIETTIRFSKNRSIWSEPFKRFTKKFENYQQRPPSN